MIIALAALLSFYSVSSFSQITNIRCADSSLVIDNVYAGILNSVNFQTKKFGVNNTDNLRFGAMATWNAKKWLSIKSFAVYGKSAKEDLILNSFSACFHNESLSLELGKMGTPATELRPLPMTGNGQFETWTEAQFSNSGLGVKFGYQANGFKTKLGAIKRGKNLEVAMNAAWKNVAVTSVIGGRNANEYIFGFTHSFKNAYQVGNFQQVYNADSGFDQIIGYFLNYEVAPKNAISLYLDAGYNLTAETWPRWEAGAIKAFTSPLVKGLVALGYDAKNESINGYIFVHL